MFSKKATWRCRQIFVVGKSEPFPMTDLPIYFIISLLDSDKTSNHEQVCTDQNVLYRQYLAKNNLDIFCKLHQKTSYK